VEQVDDTQDTETIDVDSSDTGEEPVEGPVATDALERFDCFEGLESCAEEGPYLDGTCCSEGPALVPTGTAGGSEVVGMAVQGDLVVACGGFGARISKLIDSELAHVVGVAGQRCQRATFGANGTVYITHHGDTWVEQPSLSTWSIDGEELSQVSYELDEVLYEGVAWTEDTLYVAVHGGGVRVYDAPEKTQPTHIETLEGFDNALALQTHDGHLYVLDEETLQVWNLDQPKLPTHLTTVTLPAKGRELDLRGDVLAIALGSQGVGTWDISDPSAPTLVKRQPTGAAIMDVALAEDRVALAAWTHIQVRNTTTLDLLATVKTRDQEDYEQDLAVAWGEGELIVGEWEGVRRFAWREGYVGADIWSTSDAVWVAGESALVSISNRGPLVLNVNATVEGGTVDPSSFSLGTDEGIALTVTASNDGALVLTSNDVDGTQNPWSLPIYALSEGGHLGVGEKLTAEFGFLSETGITQDLEGQVLVLSYFALF
jgi:hypothetical protein